MQAPDSRPTFFEFFAGGGMARLGLGRGWRCTFANDFDAKKRDAYSANFGDDEMVGGDVWDLDPLDLPDAADLAWASFPCQDVSVAGGRSGLAGERSSAFFGFWRLIEALREEGRAPRLIVLENVAGVLTSNGGRDFHAIAAALVGARYRFGALEIDAAAFTPQSRPRIFLTAVLGEGAPRHLIESPAEARGDAFGRTDAVRAAAAALPPDLAERWVWWRVPAPPRRNTSLIDLLDDAPAPESWWSEADVDRLLAQMDPRHRAKVDDALAAPERRVGAVFRRTRVVKGTRMPRAEVRFDGLAGCLRTPGGGSSKQFLLDIEAGAVRARALSPAECGRLMGLPPTYRLPPGATQALHLIGDGVSPPAVAWLARHLLDPLSAPGRVDRLAEHAA